MADDVQPAQAPDDLLTIAEKLVSDSEGYPLEIRNKKLSMEIYHQLSLVKAEVHEVHDQLVKEVRLREDAWNMKDEASAKAEKLRKRVSILQSSQEEAIGRLDRVQEVLNAMVVSHALCDDLGEQWIDFENVFELLGFELPDIWNDGAPSPEKISALGIPVLYDMMVDGEAVPLLDSTADVRGKYEDLKDQNSRLRGHLTKFVEDCNSSPSFKLLGFQVQTWLDDTAESESKYIADDVYLSNKACRDCYTNGKCNCPAERCWYHESKEARAEGRPVLTPRRWEREANEE